MVSNILTLLRVECAAIAHAFYEEACLLPICIPLIYVIKPAWQFGIFECSTFYTASHRIQVHIAVAYFIDWILTRREIDVRKLFLPIHTSSKWFRPLRQDQAH